MQILRGRILIFTLVNHAVIVLDTSHIYAFDYEFERGKKHSITTTLHNDRLSWGRNFIFHFHCSQIMALFKGWKPLALLVAAFVLGYICFLQQSQQYEREIEA